jgi:hypothetical protein
MIVNEPVKSGLDARSVEVAALPASDPDIHLTGFDAGNPICYKASQPGKHSAIACSSGASLAFI